MPALEFTIRRQLPEGMHIIDLETIVDKMVDELIAKYPHYRNSYELRSAEGLDGKPMPIMDYFKQRIINEAQEVDSALTKQEAIRKHVNLLNLTAIRLHRLLNII